MKNKEIRSEITEALVDCDAEVLQKVNEELDLMEITEAIGGDSNLENFYQIWQNFKGQVGSSNDVNSWTAYALGLTSMCPTGEFMLPRRAFARAGFPDIDSDFDFFRRGEICQYMIDKYGRDHVGHIGTYGALKLKSAIRRVGKALDIANAYHKGKEAYVTENEQKVSEIVKSLPMQAGAFIKVKDINKEEQIIDSVEKAYRYCSDFRYYMDKYPELYAHVKNIEGVLSIFGSHAGGIVISNVPLSELAPARTSKDAGLVTQFACEDLDPIGVIKFDILALSTLTVVAESVKLIQNNYGIDLDIEHLPLDDDKVLATYRNQHLTGVFQCEGRAMQSVMGKIGVNKFDDIIAAIALFRPGPMDSIPEYCDRKQGLKRIDYFHPSIEKYIKPYLEKTYGLLVYQEQIMQICNAVADFSVSEGYVVIKGISKKKDYVIKKYRQKFIDGAAPKGISSKVAIEYWERFIVPFARYGFNIAHSAAYAYLSYMTAYLKVNYSDEFACAFLNVETKRRNQDKIDIMVKSLKRFNIKLLPRSINSCGVDYKIMKKRDVSSGVKMTEISPSLMCPGLGQLSAKEIEDHAPYTDLRDLAAKTESRLVGQEAITALTEYGYFNNYIKMVNQKNRKEKITKLDVIKRFANIREDFKKAAKKGVISHDLFS